MTFLDEVRKKLDLPSAEKAQVMRELESHYHEVEDEALNAGMNEYEASAEAAKRLGDPSDIAQRMQAVHTRATWKTAILTALPFLGYAITYTLAILNTRQGVHHPFDWIRALVSALLCIVLISGSVRELKADRRPLWLATWLPIGFILLLNLVMMISRNLIQIPPPTDNYATHGTYVGIFHMGLRNTIEMLLLGSMSVWAYRQSDRWRSLVIGITITGLVTNALAAFMIYSHHGNMEYLLLLIRWLFSGIGIMSLVIQLFIRHPYGNKVQASIMLYALLMPGLQTRAIDDINLIFWLLIIHAIVSALMILSIARMPQWQVKQWLLCATIVILALLGAIMSLFISHAPNGVALVSVSLMNTVAYLAWIVFVPEMIDRHYKKNKPELVH